MTATARSNFALAVTASRTAPQDGFALVDASGHVVQFLSYEGVITGAPGTPAAGITSTDVGVSEEPAPGAGLSLQLTGSGASYADFTWAAAVARPMARSTPARISSPATRPASSRSPTPDQGRRQRHHPDAGHRPPRRRPRPGGGRRLDAEPRRHRRRRRSRARPGLSGHIDFAAGVSQVQIAVAIAGDTVGEANETFHVTLSNPVGNISITDASATGTILNDDPIA